MELYYLAPLALTAYTTLMVNSKIVTLQAHCKNKRVVSFKIQRGREGGAYTGMCDHKDHKLKL